MKDPIVDFSAFSFERIIADKEEVMATNPHRHELALLDGILYMDEEKAVGYYNVPEEPFWARGHFPGNPLMPGVLISEVAAQLTSYIATKTGIRNTSIIGLAGLENIKFRAMVAPGDVLTVMARIKKARKGAMIVTEYQVYVGETIASEGEIKGVAIAPS